MTPPTIATANPGSAATAGSVRKRDPSVAHEPRDRSASDAHADAAEFGAMLLAAGVFQSGALANSIGAFGSGAGTTGAGRASRDGPASKPGSAKPGDTHAQRLITSQSVSSLTQSDADRLRTVGPGVSLAAIAHSELARPMDSMARAELGQAPAPTTPGARDAGVSAPDSSNADSTGREHTRSGTGTTHATSSANGVVSASTSPTRISTTASAQAPAAASVIGALDRLAGAAARAHNLRSPTLPTGAISTRAIAGAGAAANGTGTGATGSQTSNTPGLPPGLGTARAQNTLASRPLSTPHAERPHIPRDQFVQQVHRALGLAIRSADGPVTIRLTPEHLGQLRVDLSRGEAGVTARFEAATTEAQKLLESSMPDLRAALEARGLQVDRLDVRLAEQPVAHPDAERRAGHDSPHGDRAANIDQTPAETGHDQGSSGGGHAQGQRTAPTHGAHDPEQDAGQDDARPNGTEADSVIAHDPGAGLSVSTFELVA